MNYSGIFTSSFVPIVYGEVEIKDKTDSSALCIFTYRGTFRKNQNLKFPFLVSDTMMTALLENGQKLSFNMKKSIDPNTITGDYSSENPMDKGTFRLTLKSNKEIYP